MKQLLLLLSSSELQLNDAEMTTSGGRKQNDAPKCLHFGLRKVLPLFYVCISSKSSTIVQYILTYVDDVYTLLQ